MYLCLCLVKSHKLATQLLPCEFPVLHASGHNSTDCLLQHRNCLAQSASSNFETKHLRTLLLGVVKHATNRLL